MIEKLKSLYDQKDFNQALDILNKEIYHLKSLRFTELKQELNKIKSAEEFQVLLRLTDYFLMYHYSSFIARYAYRRFPCYLTVSWYCEELLDNGKLLEADELISAAIAENQNDIRDCEQVERLYFCKIRCLLDMKLFNEAEKLLDKVKESPRPLDDKLGYVYMQIGNREKAEKYFQQGLGNPERGRICYLLLAELKASNGHIEEALKLIEKGEKLYPETPSFLLEKVRRYRDLGRMKEMLEVIEDLNEGIAKHAYHDYFRQLIKTAYYQLGEFDLLINEEKGKNSLFTMKNEQGEMIKLSIKPIIQKSNYCVPASLEMILTFFGEDITQDEIARHIFDFTGSKLSTTVDYLEKNGYECRYFIGRKEIYQKLLKKNIPILLSVAFEHSSHVQVMTGYDGVFDLYHIQEPNLLETMYVSASDFEKSNISTSYMSIVCVPEDRAEELSFLSNKEDEYFRNLQDLGEKLEEDEEQYKDILLEFLKANIEVPYSSIYVVKHFSFEEYSDFILQCAEKLLDSYPNNDFMNLHVAQAYMRLHKMEQAREQLKNTAQKTFSPLYHFLNGRIALYFDEMTEAIGYFRNSLQLDPDQYYTWSYLALAYLYSDDVKSAEYYSSISMELAPKERFVRFNHAAVLIEMQEYETARRIYDQLIQEEPKDGHAWYERACLDQKLGKIRKAHRGYLMAVNSAENIPFAYIGLAETLASQENKQKAIEFLKTHAVKFKEDSQFLINSGRMMAEWALDVDQNGLLEESLEMIEIGINQIQSNYKEALELYVKIVEETPFVNRAAEFLKQKYTENPSLIEFKCYQGMLYEENQQYSLAIDCYTAGIQVKSDSFPYYRLGEVYFKIGMFELAAENYKNCLHIDPKVEPAYLRLAEMAAHGENHEEEAEYLLRLLDFAPLSVNIEYLVSILDEERRRHLLDKVQSLPKAVNEIWRLDSEAYVYGALGELDLEQEKVTAALTVNPDFAELHHHQAKIFIKTKKWDKVRSILTSLLNKDPENDEIYRTLITYTASANKWSKLPLFLTQLDGKNKDRSTRFLLAAEAGKQFIMEINWGDVEEGNVFGRFVRKLKNRTKQINLFGSIIELYEMAIKLDKNNLSAVSHFARFYESFELVEDAIKILQKVLKDRWDDRLAYQLGMNYLNKEDYLSALPLFERQINSGPEDTHLRYLAALIHCEMGETHVAEEMMMRIIEENPFEDNVYLRLGSLLNEQGRHLGAKDILEKGMEYHPYDNDIMNELERTYRLLENSIVLSN